MPFVQITWLPKACRNAAVRKEVAANIFKQLAGLEAFQKAALQLGARSLPDGLGQVQLHGTGLRAAGRAAPIRHRAAPTTVEERGTKSSVVRWHELS